MLIADRIHECQLRMKELDSVLREIQRRGRGATRIEIVSKILEEKEELQRELKTLQRGGRRR